MRKVEALEAEIEKLSAAEFAELRGWLLEKDWEAWDRQIKKASASGKLDKLFEKAEAEYRKGKSTEL